MHRKLFALLSVFLPVLIVPQTQIRASQPQSAIPQGQNPKTAQAQQAAQSQPETDPQVREEDEEGIKHLLVSQIEAWNNGNLQGFMAGYWHSPDLTFFSGTTITEGWEPTLQRYQQRYKGEGKEMGQLEFQDLNIDLLGRRAAVVTGKWQLTMSDGKKPGGLFTLIFKRLPGGWRIVHDHT
ncbi:MAG TPA: nuclear transport factor 2 family protein, partial [Candidatus Solibacter sp.]|nr:nuclear transport factor 2 family protein [Candidatus Solibacter sp.]